MASDLNAFYQHRITALLNEVGELQEREVELSTFIYELCLDDCPDEYKRVVRNAVFGDQDISNL